MPPVFSDSSILGSACRLISTGIAKDNCAIIADGIEMYATLKISLESIGGLPLCQQVQHEFDARILQSRPLEKHAEYKLSDDSLALILREFSYPALAAAKATGLSERLMDALASSVIRREDQHLADLFDFCRSAAKQDKLKAFNMVFDAILTRVSKDYPGRGSIGRFSPMTAISYLKKGSSSDQDHCLDASTLAVLTKHQHYLNETAEQQHTNNLPPKWLVQMSKAGLSLYPDKAIMDVIDDKLDFTIIKAMKQEGHAFDYTLLSPLLLKTGQAPLATYAHLFRDSAINATLFKALLPENSEYHCNNMAIAISRRVSMDNYSTDKQLRDKLMAAVSRMLSGNIDLANVSGKLLSAPSLPQELKDLILSNPVCREHHLCRDLGL
ncbi:hypothetical protein DV532_26210 (plasmid) [Pseudomonas sp. Leaf58]|uniref:hypothetical protein n=1 Tax=Pseudomonas sp. Leaf58 TaxID=1736226 RepID=UPI0006FDECA5|nr:hypothetical protein [Pseudomonas sp. Leaf58]AYG47782.1 hypothetical protein DV532_26210 [Pseudomonas sp. Leaf58]KQN62653.1 hypothetical protein ASF02_10930 [Pseudomonas sp. Leaf58]